jgi:Na+-translocating ferredoxin:NAD+ oxidoreductase RnfG subunit
MPLLKHTNEYKQKIVNDDISNRINRDKMPGCRVTLKNKVDTRSQIKESYKVVYVIVILILSILFLIGTEKIANAVLESRQNPETVCLLQRIFSEASFYTYDTDGDIYTVFNNNRREIGWAFYGDKRGYRSVITVLVGLRDVNTIQGIVVTHQEEDNLYWFYLEHSNFFNQFENLNIEDCFIRYSWQNGGIDAVTGSTISSRAITDAVREAVKRKLQYIT